MVKLHCMAAVKRDAAGRVQKKLWLAKLKEHPRVNIGPARDGHDMIMAFAGDGVVRCTCRGDKTWNTGTVVNGNLAEHHKGGAAQASIMVTSTMASATAKPDDEPAGAKKSVKRAASPAAPDVTKRAAVDAAAPVEASVGPMPV